MKFDLFPRYQPDDELKAWAHIFVIAMIVMWGFAALPYVVDWLLAYI